MQLTPMSVLGEWMYQDQEMLPKELALAPLRSWGWEDARSSDPVVPGLGKGRVRGPRVGTGRCPCPRQTANLFSATPAKVFPVFGFCVHLASSSKGTCHPAAHCTPAAWDTPAGASYGHTHLWAVPAELVTAGLQSGGARSAVAHLCSAGLPPSQTDLGSPASSPDSLHLEMGSLPPTPDSPGPAAACQYSCLCS